MCSQPHPTQFSAPPVALDEPDGTGFAPWLRPSGSFFSDADDTADAEWQRRQRGMVALAAWEGRFGNYIIASVAIVGAALILWPAIATVLP